MLLNVVVIVVVMVMPVLVIVAHGVSSRASAGPRHSRSAHGSAGARSAGGLGGPLGAPHHPRYFLMASGVSASP